MPILTEPCAGLSHEADNLPPLRIHHLMACAAVGAVLFSLWRVHNPYRFDGDSNRSWFAMWAGIDVIRQSLTAIGLTFSIFSVYWYFYFKRYAALTQPGQWLLFAPVFSAMELLWMVLYRFKFGPDLNDAARNLQSGGIWPWVFTIAQVLIIFAPIAIFGWCAWKVADSLPWRLTFAVLAFEVVVIFLSGFIQQFGYTRYAFVAVPALVINGTVIVLEVWGISDDMNAGRKRLWTHWAGVSLSMTSKVLTSVGVAANLLLHA